MIAVIICSVLLLLTVAFVIAEIVRDRLSTDWVVTTRLILCCITPLFMMVTFIALMAGYGSTSDINSSYNKDLRELIEYRMEKDDVVNPDTIDKIKQYNNNITEGNNYFCRFSLKDVDNYLIDLNVYLNKFNKQA